MLHEELAAGGVLAATRRAIEHADHLTVMDAGVVAVLLRLADAIDAIDENGLNPAGKLDNVSIPTYLKYASALGLSVEGRKATTKAEEAKPVGTLAKLRQERQQLHAVK